MNYIIRIIGIAAITLIFLVPAARAGDVCSEPVPTMEGPVMGAAETGTAVCVYKGIPYAAPPMGELRWKAPQPAQQRSSTLSALSFGPECAQKGSEMPLQLGKQKIEQSRTELQSRRGELAAALDGELLDLYDRQRAAGAIGAGELQAGRCGACRIELDRGELGRISAAPEDEVLRCPECRAILVRAR